MANLHTGVYAIYRIGTRCKYIGSTTKQFGYRKDAHWKLLRIGKHHSIKLQRAWDKYGENAFGWMILHVCEPSDCLRWEQFYLDKYQAFRGAHYNICPTAGNTSGRKMKPEVKERMRAFMRTYRHSPESKKKISDAHKGSVWSLERRQMFSAIRKASPVVQAILLARNKSPRMRAIVSEKNRANKAAQAKSAAWHRGRKRTGQALINIQQGMKRRHVPTPDEQRERTRKQLETRAANKSQKEHQPDYSHNELPA